MSEERAPEISVVDGIVVTATEVTGTVVTATVVAGTATGATVVAVISAAGASTLCTGGTTSDTTTSFSDTGTTVTSLVDGVAVFIYMGRVFLRGKIKHIFITVSKTMARAVILWIFVLTLVCMFLFLGFHIVKTSWSAKPELTERYDEFKPAEYPTITQEILPSSNEQETEMPAPQQDNTQAHEMPHVVGQSEDDLRAPEPHIATPTSTYYDTPEATDPLDKVGYMDAEFGSNLRHPEQMIEQQPARDTRQIVNSGLGSPSSGPGGNNAAGYTPEMTNNGGEFMRGIIPFDSSEMGGGFSMI